MSPLGLLYLWAAALAVALGGAHSFLGEKYILIRLFRRRDLPQLFGGTEFTIRTLRFAWHLTSVAWWGAAALLFLLAQGPLSSAAVSGVLAAVFLVSAAITFIVSRGRHLAWPVLLAIGFIALYGAQA
ncbi:MAG: hypothetical protein E6H54_13740 [Betaproteobacteria bacterium]|nr:MAG: hypothetical protein E6H54_13740 [Betaproteobacteria bacterium]